MRVRVLICRFCPSLEALLGLALGATPFQRASGQFLSACLALIPGLTAAKTLDERTVLGDVSLSTLNAHLIGHGALRVAVKA